MYLQLQFNTDHVNSLASYGYDLVGVWQKELKGDVWRGHSFFCSQSIRSSDLCPLSNEVKEHFSILKCSTPGSGSWPEPHSWHSSSLLSLPAASVEPLCDASWQSVRQLHCTWKPWPWRVSQHPLHRSKQCPSASGPRAKRCTFYSVHVYSASTSILKQRHAPGSIKLQRDWRFSQQGGFRRWSQIPAEERESKKVSLLSCGIARLRQAPEPVVLKCYDISLSYSNFSPMYTWFCYHMQGEGRAYTMCYK